MIPYRGWDHLVSSSVTALNRPAKESDLIHLHQVIAFHF